jgi:hypothetical protein
MQRKDILISQVIDIDPSLKGRDMGEHAGLDTSGVLIADQLDKNNQVDVAILATVSDLPRIGPQILSLVEAGLPVVSTCEELFYPWDNNKEWSGHHRSCSKRQASGGSRDRSQSGIPDGYITCHAFCSVQSCRNVLKFGVTRMPSFVAYLFKRKSVRV